MTAQPTVVIADDDHDIRQLIAVAVRRAGAVLTAEVANGAAALAAVRQSPPDLAILDVSMPEMSGLEVCRELRSDPVDLGHPDPAAVGRCASGSGRRGPRRRRRRLPDETLQSPDSRDPDSRHAARSYLKRVTRPNERDTATTP